MRSDPTDTAARLHEEGQTLREAAELAGARRLLRRALALFERHSGARHPDVANVLLELARVAEALGETRAGIAMVARARRILAPLRGSADFDRLRVQALQLEGSLRVARGEYARARVPCRRALEIATKRLEPEDVVGALNGLAIVGKYTARYAEASRLYRAALRLAVRAWGPRSLAVASIFHNLGGLEHARGRFARAEPFARRSVSIRQARLGPSHPDVAADVAALAAILHGTGKYSEADRLYRRAIAVFTRAWGGGHVEVAFNVGQLAALCHVRGRRAEATRLYRRAIVLQRRAFGPRHPQLAITRANFEEHQRTAASVRGRAPR